MEKIKQLFIKYKEIILYVIFGVLTVLGTLENRGTVDNQGSILACGGTVTGVDSAVTEHRYEDGKCAVCGAEGPVFVCSGMCGGISNAYCEECLRSGAEPWGDLVFYISCAGSYPEDINVAYREIVRATCDRLGKTEQEFTDAVKQELLDEINELSQVMTHYKERDTRDENEEVDFFS